MTSFTYPAVRRDKTSDTYFGTEVEDPYRWLEDPDAEETKKFVADQNKLSCSYIENCQYKTKLKSRLTELFDFPKYGCPSKHGSKYFYSMNTGLQNQSVIYVQNSLQDEPKVFFDPNALAADGTISIKTKAWSESGKIFAYGLSSSGSDWFDIKFINVENGENLLDVIEKAKFSAIAWTHDDKGVFYSRFPDVNTTTDGTETSSNRNKMVYYHKLGTQQSEDVKCIAFPEHPEWQPYTEVSDCGHYLICRVDEGCSKTVSLYVTALEKEIQGNLSLSPIFEEQEEDSDFDYVTNNGTVFTFRTNSEASNWKLINIDITNPNRENWKVLIEEDKEDVLEWATCVNNNLLFICYMRDVKHELQLHLLDSGKKVLKFPLDIGSISGFSGKKKSSEIFYYFTSFITPGIIYRCDLSVEPPKPEVFREIGVSKFDTSLFKTSQVFYTSKDGTKVPMFLIHSKDMVLNGDNPCLLYGYGGFNISMSPYFSMSRLLFLDNLKGIYAIANIRGGGEYGKKWHDGGRKLNKQNCFDDFSSAAQYLQDNKYTSANKLVIQGGSNGGLLVGASVNQRPDLFRCVISQVGVMDMLRFHKFTIGHAWCSDFGCAEQEEYFEYIHKYSPLHNIRVPDGSIQYPSILLLTADHDDRVVPLHSLKFIAEAQHTLGHLEKQTNPLMIRIETKAGHGGGKPITKAIDECTDIYCFIVKNLGLQYKE